MYLLGNATIEKLNNWDNETVRYYLISNSAGFQQSIAILREKYKLKGKWRKTIKNKIVNDDLFASVSESVRTSLIRDIKEVTDFFGVQQHFVEHELSSQGKDDLAILQHYSLPIYTPPIVDSGHYIKVSAFTSEDTVLEAYRYIKSIFRAWEKDEAISGKPKIHDRDTKPRINLLRNIKLFVAIEKMFTDNYRAKKEFREDNSSTYNQIYEEAGRVCGIKRNPNEVDMSYIKRIKGIYLTEILKYYSLSRFKDCKELFKTLQLYPTS